MFCFSDNAAGLLPGALGVMSFRENARLPEGMAGFTEVFSWSLFHFFTHAAGLPARQSGG